MDSERPTITAETTMQANHRGNRWRDAVIIILALLLLFSLSFIAVTANHHTNGSDAARVTLLIPEADGKVFDGSLPTDNPDEILATLQDKVEENQFAFKINANPIFSSDSGSGDLRIENPARNRYAMQVELVLDETGEGLYSSPLIQPNQYIEHVLLSQQLPKGDHAATAYFRAVHPDSGDYMGEVAAAVKLTIE